MLSQSSEVREASDKQRNMANSKPVPHDAKDFSDDQNADVKPCLTDLAVTMSSMLETTENQGNTDSSIDFDFTSSSAVNVTNVSKTIKSKACACDRNNLEKSNASATFSVSHLCQKKMPLVLSSSSTSDLTTHDQEVLASDAEQLIVNGNGNWIKTEPASNEIDIGELTPSNSNSKNTIAKRSLPPCSDNYQDLKLDFSHGNESYDLNSVLSSELHFVGQSKSDDINDEDLLNLLNNDHEDKQLHTESTNSPLDEYSCTSNQVDINHRRKKRHKFLRNENEAESIDPKQHNCFTCWICFVKFDRCLDVKRHILKKHLNSKVLCAYIRTDSDDPSAPPQLLMYCPNKCDYVTAKLYAIPHHVASCDKPALHVAGMAFLKTQGSLIPKNVDSGNEDSTSSIRPKDVPSQARKQDRQEKTSRKSDKQETDTTGAEDCRGNFKCQRCMLIFSTSVFLDRHKSYCYGGNIQEPSQPRHERLSPRQGQFLKSRREIKSVPARSKSTSKVERAFKFKCLHCRKGFLAKRDYVKHVALSHSKLNELYYRYRCEVCQQKFHYIKCFRDHMLTHLEKKLFKCLMCDKTFSKSTLLNDHMRIIHKGKKPYKCDKCGNTFEQLNNLNRHQLTHSGEKPFKCQECGKDFRTKYTLILHIRTHTGERPYQCNVCGKSFAQSGTLSLHLKTHSEERPYVCSECSMSFKQKLSLTIHMRKHTGEELFRCEQCGKCFYHRGRLRTHMATHSGVKPHECKECGKRFTRTTGLKNHMRIHTGERPYQCKVCWKRFTRSTHLTVHRRSHTGEKPYQCMQCDKRFMHNISLRIHMKSRHERQISKK